MSRRTLQHLCACAPPCRRSQCSPVAANHSLAAAGACTGTARLHFTHQITRQPVNNFFSPLLFCAQLPESLNTLRNSFASRKACCSSSLMTACRSFFSSCAPMSGMACSITSIRQFRAWCNILYEISQRAGCAELERPLSGNAWRQSSPPAGRGQESICGSCACGTARRTLIRHWLTWCWKTRRSPRCSASGGGMWQS